MFSHVSVCPQEGGSTWAGIDPPGRYPLGKYTPRADTPTPRPQYMLGYGQQADGTHPTGMHSCYKCFQPFSVSVGLFCSTPAVAVGRAVPRKVAMEMLFTGQPITAQGLPCF